MHGVACIPLLPGLVDVFSARESSAMVGVYAWSYRGYYRDVNGRRGGGRGRGRGVRVPGRFALDADVRSMSRFVVIYRLVV